jgi:hypothetical protein
MLELLGLVTVWCLLIAAAILASARRTREFERALAAAGFVSSSSVAVLPDVFRRPGSIVTRVVTGLVQGVPTTFVFGFRPGTPPPLEGTFVNPSIPIAAVLIQALGTRVWLDAWTDQRAHTLGWRPAYVADVTSDGRILLGWDDFGEDRTQFESCCAALARSLAKGRAPGLRRVQQDRLEVAKRSGESQGH